MPRQRCRLKRNGNRSRHRLPVRIHGRDRQQSGPVSEGLGENLDIRTPRLKQVDVKAKWFTGRNGLTVQVRGANNERPRPIAQTAWSRAQGQRLENLRVRAPAASLAFSDAPSPISEAVAYAVNFL